MNELDGNAKADQFCEGRLLGRAFDLWLDSRKTVDEAERRSRMYSVFSGWKFYTKERTLLKRYLFECGESIGDVSMMTTVELRDAVNQRKSGGGAAASRNNESLTGKSLTVGHSMLDSDVIQNFMNSQSQAVISTQVKNTNNSMISAKAPKMTSMVNTPSFMRESLPEASNAMRMRHMSPDLVLMEAGVESRKAEMVKSAEETTSRKKSSSVMSLLQRQFGGPKE